MLLNFNVPRDWIVDAAPWQWAMALGVAAIIAVGLYGINPHIGRRATGMGLSTAGRLLLGLLRFAVVAGLGFLLLEPWIRNQTFDEELPIAVMLVDESSSILARSDSAATVEKLTQWADEVQSRLEAAGLLVERFGFAGDLRLVEPEGEDSFSWKGTQTNLDASVHVLSERLENRNVAGIVLASDGLFNRGAAGDYGIDWPNIPVWTVGLGDTTKVRDRWVERVNHNPIAYLGNTFPVEVFVQNQGFRRQNTRVEVLQSGRVIAAAEQPVSSSNEIQKFAFQLAAEAVGMQPYEVRIQRSEEEYQLDNNRRTFYVEVRESRRVITCIADAPHPDLGAIEMALAPLEAYEVRTFHLGKLRDAGALTKALAESDVVIAHNVLGDSFGGMPWQRLVAMNETPVWWIVGNESGKAYLQSENALGMQLSRSGNLTQTHRARLNPTFGALTFPEGTATAIRTWPPILGPFEQATWSPAWTPLLYRQFGDIETDDSFWAVSNSSSGNRQILTIGEGLWRWRMRGYVQANDHGPFNEFIQRQVQYLAAKDARKRLLVQTKDRIATDERLEFQGQALDAAWNPTRDASITLSLTDRNGQTFTQPMLPTESGYQASFGRMPEGSYQWEASCDMNGTTFSTSGNVVIEDRPLEHSSLAADHGVLARISERTGGTFLGPVQQATPESVSEGIQQLGVPATVLHEQTTLMNAVDWWLAMALLMGLLTVEWIIRRRALGY